MGPDGEHHRVLVELPGVIVRSLSDIFERSWKLGEVPDVLGDIKNSGVWAG